VIPLPGFDPDTGCTNKPAEFFTVPTDSLGPDGFESYKRYGRGEPDWFMSRTYDAYQAAKDAAAAAAGAAAAGVARQPKTKGKPQAVTFMVSVRAEDRPLHVFLGNMHIEALATAARPTAEHLEIGKNGMGASKHSRQDAIFGLMRLPVHSKVEVQTGLPSLCATCAGLKGRRHHLIARQVAFSVQCCWTHASTWVAHV
jgi:hypothetical protein